MENTDKDCAAMLMNISEIYKICKFLANELLGAQSWLQRSRQLP